MQDTEQWNLQLEMGIISFGGGLFNDATAHYQMAG
jgi:hypothetical protein